MNYTILTEPKDMILLREEVESLEAELNYANEKIQGWVNIVCEKDTEINALKEQITHLRNRKWWQMILKDKR